MLMGYGRRWMLRLGDHDNSKQRHCNQVDDNPGFLIAHIVRYATRERQERKV